MSSVANDFQAPSKTQLFAYLNSMPDMLAAAYRAAQPLSEGKATCQTDMQAGSYLITETIEQMWLRLTKWFPPNHFGGRSAADYFAAYLSDRATWQLALAEPLGVGKHGTSVFVITADALIEDAEHALLQTVRALIHCYGDGSFDFEAWKKKWGEASRV
jgi:hypothetical protein